MRIHIFAASLAALPMAATAQESVPAKQSSILHISCEHCPPLKAKSTTPDYQAPVLSGDVQETVIREVDGKPQMERADKWMGGAPVRFVSRSEVFLPPEAGVMASKETNVDKPNDGVDAVAKTSAVEGVKPIDAEALPLRN